MKYFIRQNLEILVFCAVLITVAAGTAALYFAEELLTVAEPIFIEPAEDSVSNSDSHSDSTKEQ